MTAQYISYYASLAHDVRIDELATQREAEDTNYALYNRLCCGIARVH